MAYDVRAVAASLDAELFLGGVDAGVPVNEAILLEQLVVGSAPGFASAVVGSPDAFANALADEALSAHLATCVAVVAEAPASPGLTARLATERITTIHAGAHAVEVAHLTLAARIATDQAAEDRRVTTGTKVLTQVARRGGVVAVVAEMAHRIDGWAVLLDARGELITTAGAGSLHVRDAVAVALRRPVRVRHTGLQVHPVGQGEDISAYLVIGARGPTSRSRDLASQAAALLDLLLRTADIPATERLGREVMLTTLLRGGQEAAALLRRWGVHETSLTAFAVASRSRTIDPESLAIRWLDDLGAAHVLAPLDGRVLGFIRDDRAQDLANIVEQLSSEGRMPLRLGLGSSAKTQLLARSAAEARKALDVAVVDARPVVWYRSLATVSYVLDHLDDGSTARIAAVLDPLRDEEGRHGELLRTLEIYLAEHGVWGATATRLGVHRQTLASRIRRVEELTELSMANPDDRTTAWLAIRALQNAGASPV
ncbi:PucR family transcriptional regulator [Mycolicibacterium anyangense]|uniref:PucR family transcriptional regulator n=1 Tax=Mycolicibacterium anyangense TaxID=1431246 RepID=A0A6N4W533_9MYCO|nr:helix-turn-helix domain-containing protein [Mycolicibacterium anyangense]BBZ77066.1 PucR family transcriptional regulator [Mycolicibacterium anyangense]